jgi:hypothetical protein
MLRAIVDSFTWAPPSTRDNPYPICFEEEELPPNEVWQGGSATLNFKARVKEPLPDPVGKLIKKLQEVEWGWKQGSLSVAQIELPDEEVSILPYAGSGTRWFFNHCVRPVSRFGWRVFNGIAYAVALSYFEVEMYILSPDHPEEYLELMPGAYLLRHPFPRRGTVD